MPTTVALAQLTHPDTGKFVAAGEEITLGDEDYYALRQAGAVAASAQESKANQLEASPQGVYSARTGREDVASTKTEAKAKT